MKLIQKIMLTASALVLFASLALAQQGQPRGTNMSAENMAERQSQQMAKVLELSDEKAKEVYAINLKYAEKWAAAREEAAGERGAMREKMQAMRTEQFEALGEVLTEEQLNTWQEHMENRQGRGYQKQKAKDKERMKAKEKQKGKPAKTKG